MPAAPFLTFSELLKRYRTAAGLTQQGLADRASLSLNAVGQLERGTRREPHKDTVQLLADALRLSGTERAQFEAASRDQQAELMLAPIGVRAHFPEEGSASPLVGRARELALLHDYLAGNGPAMLIWTGEPGIGKTRLLYEAIHPARRMGWQVLAGGCHRSGGQEPYAPVLTALGRLILQRSATQLRQDLRGCSWLTRMLPDVVNVLADANPWAAPLPADQERRLMFAAVTRLLGNLAGSSGTLLILDDLQWAGSDGLDLLATLVRTDQGARVRVLGAYRDTEMNTNAVLDTLLNDLEREGLARQVELGALGKDESSKLLRELVRGQPPWDDKTLIENIVRTTAGIPYFLISYVQAVLDEVSKNASPAHMPQVVPRNLAQGIAIHIKTLSRATQALLRVVAVSEPPISTARLVVLAAHLGLSGSELDIALDEAKRARLLIDSDVYGCTFAHQLIRDVILADLSSALRAELHRKVARALETAEGDPNVEQLALHWARGGDSARAARYYELAGDQAQRKHANAEAAASYQAAVSQLDGLGRVLAAAQVREKLAAALAQMPHYEQAIAELRVTLTIYRALTDVEGQGRVMTMLGRVHADRGTPKEGIADLEAFLHGLDTSKLPAHNQAELHLALAQLHKIGGSYAQSLNAADEAGAWASEAWDHGLHAHAERARGTALLMLGRNVEGSAVMENAAQLLDASGDYWNLAHALNNLAVVRESQGDFGGARLQLERAVEAASRTGDPTLSAFMVHRCGINAFATGDWSRARERLAAAQTMLREAGQSWAHAYVLRGLGMLDLAEGHRDTAAAHLEEALVIAQRMDDVQALQTTQSLLAEWDLLESHPELAINRLAPLFERCEQEADVSILLPLLAVANDTCGQLGLANGLLDRALQGAQADHNQLELINVLRAQALIASRRGTWETAETACAQSLALSKELRIPYGEVKALFTFACVFRDKGETDQARLYLEKAHTLCHQLGERFYGQHVERMLAGLA